MDDDLWPLEHQFEVNFDELLKLKHISVIQQPNANDYMHQNCSILSKSASDKVDFFN